MSPLEITNEDLHAYVDGALDKNRIADLELWLSNHPEDAAKVHAYKLQNFHMHSLYDDVLNEPVPIQIEEALSVSNRSFVPRSWMKVAAVVVLAITAGFSGWSLHKAQPGQQASEQKFVKKALDAHVVFVSGANGVRETAIGTGDNRVLAYSRHLQFPLRVPNLAKAGFKLTGGRMLDNGGISAAQFMYKSNSHRMVTLYVQSGFRKEDMTFRFVAENDMVAFYWTDGPLGYALTGSMERGDLLDLARMVYEKLRT
jgi:anti-sigma factor RsiW